MPYRRSLVAIALSLTAIPLLAAPGTLELSDKAGDVKTTGENHGLDLVKLSIATDGAKIAFGATLKGSFQGYMDKDPILIYVDIDDDATTGKPAPGFGVDKMGFEYVIALSICVDYRSGYSSCGGGGGAAQSEVVAQYAIASVSTMGGGGKATRRLFDAPHGTVEGDHIQAEITYTDLGVKAGQTVRLVVRENHAEMDADGFLPDARLTFAAVTPSKISAMLTGESLPGVLTEIGLTGSSPAR
ncbi:MAG: hypothetical protein U0166_26975 [Acidobacteriota bacterium]